MDDIKTEQGYQDELRIRQALWDCIADDLFDSAWALLRAARLARMDSMDPGPQGRGHGSDIQIIVQEIGYDLENTDLRIDHMDPIHPPKKEEDE